MFVHFRGCFTDMPHCHSVADLCIHTGTLLCSQLPRWQVAVLSFQVFQAFGSLLPSYCICCHYWSVQKKEKWTFSGGRKFSIFQKTCPKCHHSLYNWTRLSSMPFSHFQFDVDSKTLRRVAVLMPWDGLWGSHSVHATWFKHPGSFIIFCLQRQTKVYL